MSCDLTLSSSPLSSTIFHAQGFSWENTCTCCQMLIMLYTFQAFSALKRFISLILMELCGFVLSQKCLNDGVWRAGQSCGGHAVVLKKFLNDAEPVENFHCWPRCCQEPSWFVIISGGETMATAAWVP